MLRQIVSTTDLLSAPRPPMLVESLISRQGITALSADPGVGKTFFALELMRKICQAKPVFERFKTKRNSVLFVGQDCSMPEYAKQARKVFNPDIQTATFRRTGGDAEFNPFHFGLHWLIHNEFDLAKPKDVAELATIANNVPNLGYDPTEPIKFIRTENDEGAGWEAVYGDPTGVGLIVLDTWANLHNAEENSNTEMKRTMRGLRILAQATDAAVLVLHHHSYATETNSGGRLRGASAQWGALDGWLELKLKDGRYYCDIRKLRDVKPPNFEYTMETGEDFCRFGWVGELGSGGVIKPEWEEAIEQFLNTLEPGQEFRSQEVAAFLTSRQFCNNLTEKTMINRIGALMPAWVGRNRVSRKCRGVWRVSPE